MIRKEMKRNHKRNKKTRDDKKKRKIKTEALKQGKIKYKNKK